ncbi:hypothetical protein BD626DRAFT_521890, partial [Schizophyllum amplum]
LSSTVDVSRPPSVSVQTMQVDGLYVPSRGYDPVSRRGPSPSIALTSSYMRAYMVL